MRRTRGTRDGTVVEEWFVCDRCHKGISASDLVEVNGTDLCRYHYHGKCAAPTNEAATDEVKGN